MIKKMKTLAIAFMMMAGLAAPLAVPVAASAADNIDGLCRGANFTTGQNSSSCNQDGANEGGLRDIATAIVNFLSLVIGVIAVIMIIFGGFKYITSGGDSNSVSGAKNTLIYAIIGLIIVALAQFIVRFVLNTAGGFTS